MDPLNVPKTYNAATIKSLVAPLTWVQIFTLISDLRTQSEPISASYTPDSTNYAAQIAALNAYAAQIAASMRQWVNESWAQFREDRNVANWMKNAARYSLGAQIVLMQSYIIKHVPPAVPA